MHWKAQNYATPTLIMITSQGARPLTGAVPSSLTDTNCKWRGFYHGNKIGGVIKVQTQERKKERHACGSKE